MRSSGCWPKGSRGLGLKVLGGRRNINIYTLGFHLLYLSNMKDQTSCVFIVYFVVYRGVLNVPLAWAPALRYPRKMGTQKAGSSATSNDFSGRAAYAIWLITTVFKQTCTRVFGRVASDPYHHEHHWAAVRTRWCQYHMLTSRPECN